MNRQTDGLIDGHFNSHFILTDPWWWGYVRLDYFFRFSLLIVAVADVDVKNNMWQMVNLQTDVPIDTSYSLIKELHGSKNQDFCSEKKTWDRRTDEWMNRPMDGWTNGWTDTTFCKDALWHNKTAKFKHFCITFIFILIKSWTQPIIVSLQANAWKTNGPNYADIVGFVMATSYWNSLGQE